VEQQYQSSPWALRQPVRFGSFSYGPSGLPNGITLFEFSPHSRFQWRERDRYQRPRLPGGTLGNYYLPTSGGNLSLLINAGSRTASAAGLYHYTTRTDQTKDSSTVDIGFHYIALNGNGQPNDYDLDGIPITSKIATAMEPSIPAIQPTG